MTSPAIISPAQPGTQTRLAGTLRRPGGKELRERGIKHLRFLLLFQNERQGAGA